MTSPVVNPADRMTRPASNRAHNTSKERQAAMPTKNLPWLEQTADEPIANEAVQLKVRELVEAIEAGDKASGLMRVAMVEHAASLIDMGVSRRAAAKIANKAEAFFTRAYALANAIRAKYAPPAFVVIDKDAPPGEQVHETPAWAELRSIATDKGKPAEDQRAAMTTMREAWNDYLRNNGLEAATAYLRDVNRGGTIPDSDSKKYETLAKRTLTAAQRLCRGGNFAEALKAMLESENYSVLKLDGITGILPVESKGEDEDEDEPTSTSAPPVERMPIGTADKPKPVRKAS